MKRLRKPFRVDTLGKQQRAASARWSRMVYLMLIATFGVSLVYYLFGNVVILSADGIVLTDIRAVDSAYAGKIIEVYVKEGDRVETGTPLLRLEAFDMVKAM